MRKLNFILLSLLFVLSAGSKVLSKPALTYDGILLSLPVTAYNAALGSANSAFVNDINSFNSNPAGFASLKYKSIIFSHFSHFQDINIEYAGIVVPISKTNANIGLDFTFFNSGSIERNMIDANGNPVNKGTYKNYDKILGLYYAMDLPEEFNAGIGIKFLESKLERVSAQTFRGSIGIQKFFQTSENAKVSLAADIRNFGGELKFDSEKNKPKEIYRIGTGFIFDFGSNKIKTGFDLEYAARKDLNYFAGIDVLFAKILSLRGGYDSRNDADNKISLGLGLNINSNSIEKGLKLDYSYTPYGDLGNSHRFSLSFEFGDNNNSKEKILPIEQLFKNVKPEFRGQYYNEPDYNRINENKSNDSTDHNSGFFKKRNSSNDNQDLNLTSTQLFNKILMTIMSGELDKAQTLLNNDFTGKRVLSPQKFTTLNKMIIDRRR
ncbi:MAG TPA: PorV/PorQ family protein [bacterium]|nr:PorV/PorQ family protein [bacterium]HPN30651.1 PorV/PorQ family protein [bacterium]